MDLEEATEFVRTHHHGVLATVRRDGGPQLSPVVATVDAAGRVVVSTRETSAKVANLRRNPAASLCVFTDGFFGAWVQLDGTVDICTLPDAAEPLVEYYRSISGEHPDWPAYRAAMIAEHRVLLVLDVTRAGPAARP